MSETIQKSDDIKILGLGNDSSGSSDLERFKEVYARFRDKGGNLEVLEEVKPEGKKPSFDVAAVAARVLNDLEKK